MSYAQTAAAERARGELQSAAELAVKRAAEINTQLRDLLNRLRPATPEPVGIGQSGGIQVATPLSLHMERLQQFQQDAGQLLEEISRYV